MLKDKRILFFSVQTFGLEKAIKRKLISLGAHVDYYDERPSNSNFSKGIIRINRKLYLNQINIYYKRILSHLTQYDYLLVNRGEVMPVFFLKEFRLRNPKCIFIFYTWDSLANYKYPLSILEYFDKKFTFDHSDAQKYGLKLRPLFYQDEYKLINKSSGVKYDYDLLFFGTLHSDRYNVFLKVKKKLSKFNLKIKLHLYFHGRFVYLYKLLFDKTFKYSNIFQISFKHLDLPDIVKLYSTSNTVLDVSHPMQNGLTMRTIESIGAGRKIITTNYNIKRYCFFDDNIYVVDKEDLKLDYEFLKKQLIQRDSDILYRLSLEGWIKEIFFESHEFQWLK